MSIAFLTLTTRCNRSCAYCFYETGYADRGDPDQVLPVHRDMLTALAQAGVDKLILTGGEPLLLPDLEETVRLAADHGFFTLLLTNGDLLDEPRLDKLIASGLGALSISLDDPGDDPGAKAPWALLSRLAQEQPLSPAVITPVTRINLAAMTEIIRRIHDMGLYLLIQPVFVPRDHPRFETLSLALCNPEEKRRLCRVMTYWESCYSRTGYASLVADYYSSPGRARPQACHMGTETVVIDSSGEVSPCFHRRDLAAGNLLTGNPAAVLARSFELGEQVRSAPCFGEHCISLFSHL